MKMIWPKLAVDLVQCFVAWRNQLPFMYFEEEKLERYGHNTDET